MNRLNTPGFTADRSIGLAAHHRSASRSLDAGATDIVTPAEQGGPGTVPVGYGRDCKLVPYWICIGKTCYVEYYEYCVTYPLPRGQFSAG